VRAILRARAGISWRRATLVAVTGIDGSGKGTLTGRMLARLRRTDLKAVALGADAWLNLPPTRFNRANPAEHFYDHALRLDEMLERLVLPLRDARRCRVAAAVAEETSTEFRRHLYRFDDVDVVLVEGIFLLKLAYQGLYDLSFWVDCTFETALERALARRQEGLSLTETIRAYETTYFPAQLIHLRRDAPRSAATAILCFNWYRIRVTVPERIGAFTTAGATAVFEIVVDDYAEVWVDGQLPRELGQSGKDLIRGWNAPNRLVVGRDVRPGQEIQLAVFGINGPLSDPPPNFIWVRSARLEFYREPRAVEPHDAGGIVERLDPGLDAIVPKDAVIEKVAEGFLFTEGPVWAPEGYLLFSDPNANRIYRWTPEGRLDVFREPSGYDGADIAEYKQPGSNGLTFDREGRLTINEHGNRRVIRLEASGGLTLLADAYRGKRLNSPNDLVYRSDGALYFTDPPFGLPKFFDDPRKELPFSGVYVVKDGKLRLLSRELTGPNGIAFSPDERFLYVGDWDDERKVVLRYPVKADGGVGPGEVFADLTAEPGEDAIDGIKVDRRGDVYVSGPGDLWIFSPEGKRLGMIVGPEHPHNFAWGDADGRTLYLCARGGLYRIRLSVAGIRPEPKAGR
jgi:gluconolactonase